MCCPPNVSIWAMAKSPCLVSHQLVQELNTKLKYNVSHSEVHATKLMALGKGGLAFDDHEFRKARMTRGWDSPLLTSGKNTYVCVIVINQNGLET